MAKKNRSLLLTSLKDAPPLVSIHSFILMPNHFHLLLSQTTDSGISLFMQRTGDSYTRYFNTKNERVGPLFQGQFKAVRIESDEQLLHVSRYIHLNPYTSYVVGSLNDALHYPWSSLHQYRATKGGICNVEKILGYFKNYALYEKFLQDQADYQRKLGDIKHLLLEK